MADPFTTNLPIQLTSFIGREREMKELERLLATTRLLTLTGEGGVGKTRLALEIASHSSNVYEDGACWVDLVPLADPTLVPQFVARALDVREQPDQSVGTLVLNYIGSKQLLLVLDNCEHLIEACAELAVLLLSGCPHLRILTTTREALGITGETTWHVPSLSLPDPQHWPAVDRLVEYEALQLFVERAVAVKTDFTVSEQNALPIAQICRRLDGIPLAIELAAARVKTLAVQQIAARLDDRLTLLTRGSRTALPRHQTLRATMDWSYDLLSEPERVLFRRLAVFAGGWTLEATESVCSADERPMTDKVSLSGGVRQSTIIRRQDVLELLSRLVDKSLVIAEEREGAARYRMLETIWQYARDKLSSAGEQEPLSESHFDYFLKFAEEAEPTVDGLRDLGSMARVEAEHNNLRGALAWGIRHNVSATLKMLTFLSIFWISRGHEVEGRRWITDALAQADQLPKREGEAGHLEMTIRAYAMQSLARIAYSQGDNAHGLIYSEQTSTLARELGDERLLAFALGQEALGKIFLGDTSGVEALATESLNAARRMKDESAMGVAQVVLGEALALRNHDLDVAHRYAEQGLGWLDESGDRWMTAMAILSLGFTAKLLGGYTEARRRFSECLPVFQEVGDNHRINIVYSELGHIERYEGRYQQAARLYRETIQEWQRLNHRGAVAHELECFAFIAKGGEHVQRAARLLGAAQVLREKTEMPMSSPEQVEYDREMAALRARMDEKDFAAAWTEGQGMTTEQAIEYALKEEPAKTPAQLAGARTYPAGLTEREVEVLRWLATGLSNQEIADKLMLSKRTVEAHLRSIFSKLDVTTRSAATRAAIENKIV